MTNPPKEKDTPKEAANELEEVYQYLRRNLAGETLDELCDDIRADDHGEEGGACWDIVNQLSGLLAPIVLSLTESEKLKVVEEYRKRLIGKLKEEIPNEYALNQIFRIVEEAS